MGVLLNRLSFDGQECMAENREKAISENQKGVLSLIRKYFNDEFNGNTFGEAWDFIMKYRGRTYKDEKGNIIEFNINGNVREENSYLQKKETRVNYQEDYFQERYEALVKGDCWDSDDKKLNDEIENQN